MSNPIRNVRIAGDTKTQITAPYNSGMVNEASKGIAPLNRQLTEQECDVLTWLLEHGVPGAPDFTDSKAQRGWQMHVPHPYPAPLH